jgi:CrcB protein
MVQDSRVPRPDRQEILAIAVGGAAGALLRVFLARTYTSGSASWPWATFGANMAGALVLGYAVTRLQERLPLSAYRRPLIGTGFCGALTTFSTMQLELLHMLDAHRYGLAAAYTATSIVAGYACVHVASALVRRVRVIA